MLKPGMSAIEAGIRLAFLPCRNWEEFDKLHLDVFERMKSNSSNPRKIPNYIDGDPDLLEYDHKHDIGEIFIWNSISEAYRNADLIIATYKNQTKHPSSSEGRSTLCLSDPRTTLIDKQTRFTIPSVEAWCIDQGYHLAPKMDDETLKLFLGYLSQDLEKQFNSTFDLSSLLDKLNQELSDQRPTNQYRQLYLTSYIYALSELKNTFGRPNIEGKDLLIKPQTFETHEAHQAKSAELSAQSADADKPLKPFHEMANLSFKEVEFVIDPESAVIRVVARSKQVSVAYSDLGLTHKASKVRLNAQGDLFVSLLHRYIEPKTTEKRLNRLTNCLKKAFNISESPFIKGKPIYKSRIPKDATAKRDGKWTQTRFDEKTYGPNDADCFLSDADPTHDSDKYAN